MRVLASALASGRLHHAYLFTGTRGVGKTTLARILAKALNCTAGDQPAAEPCGECSSCREIAAGNSPDVLELDAASHTQVDSMRELIEAAQYAPSSSRYKVYIIDEVHMLSKHAFNAMLKTLEEPPDHAKFILATTDPQMVPATVLSRCMRFALQRLEPRQIGDQLAAILKSEGLEHEDEAIAIISRAADGSLRDALSILDEAAAAGSPIQADAVRSMVGALETERVLELLAAVAAGDAQAVRASCDRMYAQAASFDSALGEVAGLLHRAALAKLSAGTGDAPAGEVAGLFADGTLQALYEVAVHARQTLQWAPDYRSGFEMALLRMLVLAQHAARQPAPAAAASAPAAAAADPAPAAVASASPVSEPDRPAAAAAAPRPKAERLPKGQLPANEAQWHDMVRTMISSAKVLARECVFISCSDKVLKLGIKPEDRSLLPGCESYLKKSIRNQVPDAELEFETVGAAHQQATPAEAQERQKRASEKAATAEVLASPEFGSLKEALPDVKLGKVLPKSGNGSA